MNKEKDQVSAKIQIPSDKIVEFVVLFASIAANYLYNIVKWWVVLINFALLVVGYFIIYFLNNKSRIKSINNEIEQLQSITQNIKELSSYPALIDHVCGSKGLMMIEGSVGENEYEDHKIYLQSSKFELESDEDFSRILINNLRKGVEYNYLIPLSDNKIDYQLFYEMVIGWWKDYSRFIVDKEFCNELNNNKSQHWQKKYVNTLEMAASYWTKSAVTNSKWDKLIDDLYELFKKRLFVFVTNQSIFYIVTAIYQVGPNRWKAIIKLPTEYGDDSNDDYYSFVVFGNSYSDSNNSFIKQFMHNFRDENQFDMTDLYAKLSDRVGDLKNEKHKSKS